MKFKNGLFPSPDSEKNIKKYLELDDWTLYSAFKKKQGGPHGDIILNRTPYKCKKEWDSIISEEDRAKVEEALSQYQGFLDTNAVTKWYKLDKDIPIYDEDKHMCYPLSFKSKIIEVMPGLPKTIRLYIYFSRG